jgi:hypothetical protein
MHTQVQVRDVDDLRADRLVSADLRCGSDAAFFLMKRQSRVAVQAQVRF